MTARLGVTVSGDFVQHDARPSFGKGAPQKLYAMDESVDLQNDAGVNNMLNANAMRLPQCPSSTVRCFQRDAALDRKRAFTTSNGARAGWLKWLGDNGYLTEARAFRTDKQPVLCASRRIGRRRRR